MKHKKLRHIGFIMDGNRRWAQEQGLTALQGHAEGYKTLKKVGKWCQNAEIEVITVFAFSTENWKRSKREVSYLFRLLEEGLQKDLAEFNEMGYKLRFIGRIKDLPIKLQKQLAESEKDTEKNTSGVLQIALNYGGHAEIVDVVKGMIADNISVDNLTEESFEHYLYTKGECSPDLIIRTSGEMRLSGFMLWQSAYSELYFTDTYWPAFSKKDFNEALEIYAKRQRRFGGA